MKNLFKERKNIFIVVVLVLVLLSLTTFFIKRGVEKKQKKEIQTIEQQRQERMGTASWSRVSFFETLPINATFAMPSYLEGNYRLVKNSNQASFFYIKDPSNPVEMLMIKVFPSNSFSLPEGESELLSLCQDYKFSYRLAKESDYKNSGDVDFLQALQDIKFFLDNDGYFECRPKE